MRWLWIFAWTYLVFAVQTAFAGSLAIAGCAPHLVLAGVVLMTRRVPERAGLVVAAGWGLLSDCLTDGRLGPEIVAFVVAAALMSRLSGRWNLKSPGFSAAAGVAIVWVALVISAGLRMVPDGRIHALATLAGHAARSAIWTGALVAIATLAARLIISTPAESDPAATPAMSNKWRMLTEYSCGIVPTVAIALPLPPRGIHRFGDWTVTRSIAWQSSSE